MKDNIIEKLLANQLSGTTETYYYGIAGTNVKLPTVLIKGKQDGATLLITAGIHGSEYAGIEAAKQMIWKILPHQLAGNVILVPCVNQKAFYERKAFINPLDGKNVNRCFPGKEVGTESERIAYALSRDFFTLANFYLDFHSGDLPETLNDFVFIPSIGEMRAERIAKQAARCLEVPFGVLSKSSSGATGYACRIGLPALLVERGQFGERSKAAIAGFYQDTLQVMRYLKMLNDSPITKKQLRLLEDIYYLHSGFTGLWTPAKRVGEVVKQGEKLGIIEDFFGNLVTEYIAQHNGQILYQMAGLPIVKGEHLVAYGS